MASTKGYKTTDVIAACQVAEDNLTTKEALRLEKWHADQMPKWLRLRDYITRSYKEGRPVTLSAVSNILTGYSTRSSYIADAAFRPGPKALTFRVRVGRRHGDYVDVAISEIVGLRHALEAWQDEVVTLDQIRRMGFTHTLAALFTAAELDPHKGDDDRVRGGW